MVTTHAMYESNHAPICVFTRLPVDQWPQDHYGVTLDRAGEVTCPQCLEEIQEKGMTKVHALHEGKVLCYFTHEVPGKWPKGQSWAGIDEIDRVTCLSCKDRVREGRVLPGFSLGWSYQASRSYGYEEYLDKRGSGYGLLRTRFVVQPRALMPGDILATGETILSPSREGFNGAIYIHLSSHRPEGVWLDVPARIPIALLSDQEDLSPELRERLLQN